MQNIRHPMWYASAVIMIYHLVQWGQNPDDSLELHSNLIFLEEFSSINVIASSVARRKYVGKHIDYSIKWFALRPFKAPASKDLNPEKLKASGGCKTTWTYQRWPPKQSLQFLLTKKHNICFPWRTAIAVHRQPLGHLDSCLADKHAVEHSSYHFHDHHMYRCKAGSPYISCLRHRMCMHAIMFSRKCFMIRWYCEVHA